MPYRSPVVAATVVIDRILNFHRWNPEVCMRNLLEGIHRFQNDIFGRHRDLFEKLSQGQSPGTMFITCADSRVVPELFTQTGPGELFVLRNAGNIIPPYGAASSGEAATIEYAVSVLGVQDIVVCGHSYCGAIQALLDPRSVCDFPAITAWLSQSEATRRIIVENYAELTGEARINVAIQENVLVQIENLETHPAVRARLSRGRLTLHAWVYKLETGQVFEYSSEHRRFLLMHHAASRDEVGGTPISADAGNGARA